jgi:hypothetical protein
MTITILGLPPAPQEELWANASNGINPWLPDTDQGDALEDLFATAQAKERLVRLPPCNIRSARQFSHNGVDALRIVGAGMDQSVINWTADLGAGKYAFYLPKGNNVEIEDLWLRGSQATVATGTLPMQQSGVRMEGGHKLLRTRISSFGAALEIACDHTKVELADLQGNGYGCFFAPNPVGGLGDHSFVSTYFTNQNRASIAIASNAAMLNARFSHNGHIGLAPYGIMRFDVPTPVTWSAGTPNVLTVAAADMPFLDTPSFLNGIQIRGTNIPNGTTITSFSVLAGVYTLNLSAAAIGQPAGVVIGVRGSPTLGVVFENQSFEYCNHMSIYDEPGDGVWDLVFHPPAESTIGGAPVNGPEWVGKPVGTASMYVGNASRMHWVDGDAGMNGYAAGRPQIMANSIKHVRVDHFDFMAGKIAQSGVTDGTCNERPFEIIGTPVDGAVTGIVLGTAARGSGATQGSARVASEQIYKGDLVERDPGTYHKIRRSRNTVDSQILGFALNDFAINKVCVYVWEMMAAGGNTRVRNYTGSTINGGKRLTPDPANIGGVKTYTGAAGEVVVGFAINNVGVAGGTAAAPTTPSTGDVDIYLR